MTLAPIAALGAACLVAVLLFLVVAARVLRRAGRIESPEAAADAVEAALPGFAVAGVVVGADAGAALAVASDNRVAVLRRTGPRYRVAEVAWQTVRSTPDGIVVETADRRVRTVTLAGVDALDIRRLTRPDTVPT